MRQETRGLVRASPTSRQAQKSKGKIDSRGLLRPDLQAEYTLRLLPGCPKGRAQLSVRQLLKQ